MFVKLKSAESKPIKSKPGTYFLCTNRCFGLGLFIMLGKSNSDYYVSYYVDGLKGYYSDDGMYYVDDISLKRALSLNFYELAINEDDLQPIYYLDGRALFKIPKTISTRQLSKKDLQTWYLKSKMVNLLPDIKF